MFETLFLAALLSPSDMLYRAIDRLHTYGAPAYAVYELVENAEYRRVAFRGSDEMMNDAQLPAGPDLPQARIYRAFVGPLAYTVHEAIATPAPSATAAAVSPGDLESTLHTIASVSAHGHIYDVRDVGIETINGHRTYHLELRPRRDPERYPLRDLWLDTTTYDVWRAGYREPPDFQLVGGEADLTVNFKTVGRYRIADSWAAVYHGPDLPHPVYRIVVVVNMSFPESLPGWIFDRAEYERRFRAHDPDVLGRYFSATPPP